VISDFRVMGDQEEVFGQFASVPAAWCTLKETAAGGDRTRRKINAAVNKARRDAWSLDASMTACILLSWLRHLALDGKLAKAEPKALRPVNRTNEASCVVPGTGVLQGL
jgi:hypothetical protein